MTASCPSCAGPFAARNPGIVTAVCEFCGSVFWWEEDDLLAAGTRSVLGEGFTRLYRGAVGELHNVRFRVLGRVRYAYARGFWDEWYVALDDGGFVWITEDDHELMLESPLDGKAVPTRRPEPGERFAVGDETFQVEEVGEAECVGLEGELPERWEIGERYRFADAAGLDGRASLSIEYDGPVPTVFRGRWLAHKALRVDERGGAPPDPALGADALRFLSGRARPPHEPRTARCVSCGSPVTVQDEATRLVVCGNCGTPLELTEAEARAVGARSTRKVGFTLDLGAPLTWRGERYEVAARMVFIEDGDPSDPTHQYLLYSPVAGSFWLDRYGATWTATWATHTVPLDDPRRAGRVRTGDGRAWKLVERGEYETWYVDGALPWVAKVGDRIAYAELTGEKRTVFEMQTDRGEHEYAEGVVLTTAEARDLLGDAAGPPPGVAAGFDVGRFASSVALAAGVALVLQIAAFTMVPDGEQRLAAKFTAQHLDEERTSGPFEIRDAGAFVRIDLAADRLADEWMDVDIAWVEGDDTVVHVTDPDLSYYSGYEGGESWSEGSHATSEYVAIPRAGIYRLVLHAVGGAGESTVAGPPSTGLAVTVTEGAYPAGPLGAGMVISVAALILGVFVRVKAGSDT